MILNYQVFGFARFIINPYFSEYMYITLLVNTALYYLHLKLNIKLNIKSTINSPTDDLSLLFDWQRSISNKIEIHDWQAVFLKSHLESYFKNKS